jgi:hypothetical protein
VQIHASLTPPDEAFAYARLSDTFDNKPFPRTLRDHIGARELGDFGTVLMAERPASADLTRNVERWRASDVTSPADLLRPHPDQIAEDRRFNLLFVLIPMMIVLMVLTGLIGAWVKGVI